MKEACNVGQRVTLYQCPACGGPLAHIDLIEGSTSQGVLFGQTFVKCKSGCSKGKILRSKAGFIPKKPLPAKMFLEVIEHARSLGKRISTADKNRELAIKMRLKRAIS